MVQKVVHVMYAGLLNMMLVTAAEKMEWAVMAIALNLHWTTFRLHTMYVLTENLVSDSKILSSLTFHIFPFGN